MAIGFGNGSGFGDGYAKLEVGNATEPLDEFLVEGDGFFEEDEFLRVYIHPPPRPPRKIVTRRIATTTVVKEEPDHECDCDCPPGWCVLWRDDGGTYCVGPWDKRCHPPRPRTPEKPELDISFWKEKPPPPEPPPPPKTPEEWREKPAVTFVPPPPTPPPPPPKPKLEWCECVKPERNIHNRKFLAATHAIVGRPTGA